MKTCKECGIEYDDYKKFCKKCGSALTEKKKIETMETVKKLVFEERLKADPLNLEILKEFSLFLLENRMFIDTINISLRILAIDENDLITKKTLTKAYLMLNEYEKAIESAEQLVSEKPDDTELLKILINELYAHGKYEKAILYCDKLLALEPLNNKILHTKALSLLLSAQIVEASHIFAKLKKEGFKDLQTLIYAGINCILSNEFEAAIEIFNPVLSDKESSNSDMDINRGFLFMAFCLSQFENTLVEVDEWLSKIDFQILQKNRHPLDVQTYLKLTTSVFEFTFARKKLVLSRYKIENFIHKYLDSKSSYLAFYSKDLQAELWYKISLIQAEMRLFDEAKQSLNKSIALMPLKTEYSKTITEVSQLHEDKKRLRKKETIIILSIVTALLLIVYASVYFIKRQKENKAWKVATAERTLEQYKSYIEKYPKGKYTDEARNKLVVSDNRDGKTYKIDKIGQRWWMTENLNVAHFRNGDPIPHIKTDEEWILAGKQGQAAWCYYDNDPANGEIYGKLYNWYAVNDSRGLAPVGYHIPSDAEWLELIDNLGINAGGKLKEIGTKHWNSPNTGATNETGFLAFPGGYRGSDGYFYYIGSNGYWWSSTGFSSENAWYWDVGFDHEDVYYSNYGLKTDGNSVRCFRD